MAWRRLVQRLALLPQARAAAESPRAGLNAQLTKGLNAQQWRHLWEDRQGYQHFGPRSRALTPFQPGPRAQVWLGGTAGAFVLYWWYCREEVPFTHRRHSIMFVSVQQEKLLGEAVFEQQKREAQKLGQLLPPSHPYSRLVHQVGSRVAAAAVDGSGGGRYSHMRNLDWEYAVVDSPVVNAYVVPSGKVVVFTGLLNLLETEGELAAVMAHETGHVLARHHAERMSTLNLISLFKLALNLLFNVYLPDSAAFLGVFLPYSRLQEYEADHIGLMLMARACYSPKEATSMLAKLHAAEKEQERETGLFTPAFLRTHPLGENRVQRVRDRLPQAYDVYERSGCSAMQLFATTAGGADPWRSSESS